MTRRVHYQSQSNLGMLQMVDDAFYAYTTGVSTIPGMAISGTPASYPVCTRVSAGVWDVTFAGGTTLRVCWQDHREVIGGATVGAITWPANTTMGGPPRLNLAMTPTSFVMTCWANNTAYGPYEHYAFEEPVDASQDGVNVSRLFHALCYNGSEYSSLSRGYLNDSTATARVDWLTRLRWETTWMTASGTYSLETGAVSKHAYPLYFVRTDGTLHFGDGEIVIWPNVLTFDDYMTIGTKRYSWAGPGYGGGRAAILIADA